MVLSIVGAFFAAKTSAQVSNIHGAWIEVSTQSDSMELKLIILSKQGQFLAMSQTVNVFRVEANGNLNALPATQLERIYSSDSANLRFSVYSKKLPPRNAATLFAWNACCRGSLLNASLAATNESMVAYTKVYPDVTGGNLLKSLELRSYPELNYTRGIPQSVSLNWNEQHSNSTTSLIISTPIASISNSLVQPVSSVRLPNSNEMQLNSNTLSIFAPEAGQLAFNIRYQTTTQFQGNVLVLSEMEAAFQASIEQASSLRNLFEEAAQAELEVYDMLGRLIVQGTEKPILKTGIYLFKRGNRIEKVQVF